MSIPMKSALAAVACSVVLGVGVLLAQPGPTTAPATQPARPVNQFCAVMGGDHKVDPKVTVVHDGKTVGFCCAECIPEFRKDPEKFMAKLK